MKVVIDTNSLLSLVRYYLPFDKNGILYNFIKDKIEQGEIVVIDKVHEECSYYSKGLVIKSLKYLNEKEFLKSAKLPINTDSLIAPSTRQFLHQLNTVFVNHVVKNQRGLTDVEFESQKKEFLNNADMKLIILCLNMIQKGEDVILVTEETESGNDNKLFKKIPAICKELNIKTMTLPELLDTYDEINIHFN